MTAGKTLLFASVLAGAALAAATTAFAEETVRVAIGQRQVWDSQIVPLGIQAGIFKKHGIDVDITGPRAARRPSRPRSPAASISRSPTASRA